MGNSKKFSFAAVLVLFASLATAISAHASQAPVVLNYDLTTGGTESNTGDPNSIGNIWSYTQSGGGTDFTLEVTAWSDTGTGNTFAAAAGMDVGGFLGDASLGLGVCNSAEMPLASTCLRKTKNNNQVVMDNRKEVDWLLLLFPDYMTINSFEVTPDGRQVRSVSYFTGIIDSAADIDSLTSATLAGYSNGIGFDAQTDVSLAASSAAATINLGATDYRNALLIGASLDPNERNASITLTNVNVSTALILPAVVPIPAAVWLFGSGLGFLCWMRRRQNS